jgi:hypothetical protein
MVADLKFSAPEFRTGLNLSVRRGTKWNDRDGEFVNLVGLDGTIYHTTQIWTEVVVFDMLSDHDLYYEHEKACRTAVGLLTDMQENYDGFETHEVVTLVWFMVKA